MGRRRRKKGCIINIFMTIILLCLIGVAVHLYLGENGQKVKRAVEAVVKPQKIPFQEIKIEEEALDQKYYYQQLGEKDREAYKEILQGVKENQKEIYVHSGDAQKANALFQQVLKDFPEVFWCEGTTSATQYEGKESYTVVSPVYLYDEEAKEVMKAKIAEGAAEYLEKMPENGSDYEKILCAYETIVSLVDYDQKADDNQNIYSVFVNKRSVCAGYSKAFQYLMEQMGIFCTYVTGTVTDGQNHAWNLVKCNEDYYYVDVTWGDPVFLKTEDSQAQKNISYDYMCCNDVQLFQTHTPDDEVPLPECTSMKDNYYVVNDMYYESYDSNEALKKMNEIISARGDSMVMKFADENVYREAHDDVFQNVIKRAVQNLAEWYRLSEVKYRYVDDARLNKIVIYWQYE